MTSVARIRAELHALEVEEEQMLVRKENLLRKLERVASRPSEPREADVITYTVQFTSNGTVYKYAAIRDPSGQWITTGREDSARGPFHWADLIEFVERDYSFRTNAAPVRIIVHGKKKEVLTW